MTKVALLIFLVGALVGTLAYARRVIRAVKLDLHGDCDKWGNYG